MYFPNYGKLLSKEKLIKASLGEKNKEDNNN